MVELVVTQLLHLRRGPRRRIATVDLLSGCAIIIVQTTNSSIVFHAQESTPIHTYEGFVLCKNCLKNFTTFVLRSPFVAVFPRTICFWQPNVQTAYFCRSHRRTSSRSVRRKKLCSRARSRSFGCVVVCYEQAVVALTGFPLHLSRFQVRQLHLHASQTWGMGCYDDSSFPVLVVRSLHKVFDFGSEGKKERKQERKRHIHRACGSCFRRLVLWLWWIVKLFFCDEKVPREVAPFLVFPNSRIWEGTILTGLL